MVGKHDEDKEHPQGPGGDREEIDRDQVLDMVGEERSPGLGRRCAPLGDQARDRALGQVNPELTIRSSPWMRGAPQSGLAAAIFWTRAALSALTGGRPTVGRPESLAQYPLKRRRCQRRTVSGVTNTRDCLHPAQTLVSPTQTKRSAVRSLGRPTVRLYTETW